MFKVNNRNTRTRCEICSKLTVKTPEPRQYYNLFSEWEVIYILLYKYLAEQDIIYPAEFYFQIIKDCFTVGTFIDLSKGDTKGDRSRGAMIIKYY